MKRTIFVGLAVLVVLGGLVEAKVYRWVDETGKTVYSQSPPPENIKGEEIQVSAPPPATAPEKDAGEQAVKPVDEKIKGNPALDPQLRKEYCEKGKKNLEVLENAGPDMGFVTEDNKLVKFTPAEKATKIKEAQAVVKAYCD
ncbi:DUF4124 domain-containing protein [Thiolapillus sp.]